MRSIRVLVLPLVLSVAAACASRPAAEGPQAPTRQTNQITVEEVREATHQNAFDLIRALRPGWLVTRGPTSIQNPDGGMTAVYMDGVHLGGVETLRQISVMDIQTAQYLTAAEATARLGNRTGGSAIVIRTRRG